MDKHKRKSYNVGIDWINIAIRIVITMIVLTGVTFLAPNFSINKVITLIFTSIIIVLIDYFTEHYTGIDASAFGRGVISFFITAAALYFLQFFINGYFITASMALTASLIIGIINAIIPNKSA